jgi:D-xylose transport system ATP-binding protein
MGSRFGPAVSARGGQEGRAVNCGVSQGDEDAASIKDAARGEPPVLLAAEGISKSYGQIEALSDADLWIGANETVALVGDNGAGKSTLIKVLSGAVTPDTGAIRINGAEARLVNPRDAHRLGINVVYQDLALVDTLDVATNIFLGRTPKRRGMVDRKRMYREATSVISGLAINVPSAQSLVGELSGGQRQAVAIARAIQAGGKLLIMDEPTAALGVQEAGRVLELVEKLKASGVAILMVSHNLEHVFAVADRIVVLRRGRVVGSRRRAATTQSEIVHMIVGADFTTGLANARG